MMKEWQDRLLHQRANYDEILLYASNHTQLHSLGHTLCVTSLVCDAQYSHQMRLQFLHEFEALNISLLKYISEQPDAKWCTLPALMQEYGVSLPRRLQEMISQNVQFPDEPNHHNWEPSTNPVPPSTTGRFQPGHEISLKLAKNVGLCQLAELNDFQQPLLTHLQMLIFFKLNKSVMFDKYLRIQISHHCDTENLQHQKLLSLLPEKGLPSMKIFVQSLKETEQFLVKAMKGDINLTIKDTFDMQSLAIVEETSLLAKYAEMCHLDFTGISKTQNILQLCQWIDYIQTIHVICQQYDLKNCIQDLQLIQLVSLTNGLISGELEVTLDDAERILKQIKEILHITNIDDTDCLKLFRAVGESESVYQQLYHHNIMSPILQHHTAVLQQLLHDTAIVKDLPAAISLMIIFNDKKQDLTSLLLRVFEFPDVQGSIQALKTINSNLPLVVQLFTDEVSLS